MSWRRGHRQCFSAEPGVAGLQSGSDVRDSRNCRCNLDSNVETGSLLDLIELADVA